MGRHREYASDADRQRAYRERKAEELARLKRGDKRKAVSAKLVKVLGMLGSDYAGERANAAQLATQILKEAGLTWYDVLDVAKEPEPRK
jgi:hypothetical protein